MNEAVVKCIAALPHCWLGKYGSARPQTPARYLAAVSISASSPLVRLAAPATPWSASRRGGGPGETRRSCFVRCRRDGETAEREARKVCKRRELRVCEQSYSNSDICEGSKAMKSSWVGLRTSRWQSMVLRHRCSDPSDPCQRVVLSEPLEIAPHDTAMQQ